MLLRLNLQLPVGVVVFLFGTLFDKEFRNVCLYRKLLPCGWVHLPISVQNDLESWEEVF